MHYFNHCFLIKLILNFKNFNKNLIIYLRNNINYFFIKYLYQLLLLLLEKN
jgi:hypothetical protein